MIFSLKNESIWKSFTGTEAFIDYTILLLDKHGDYRYNMEEKDKEVDEFIHAWVDSVLLPKQVTIW